MDPRTWDLHQLLAAYESTLRQGCKDEAEWNRLRTRLYAEPVEVRKDRAASTRKGRAAPARGALTADSVAALLGAAAAEDALYGSA